MRTALDGDRGFVELLPCQVEAITLNHRDRMVIGGMHLPACFAQCRNDSVAPTARILARTEAVDQQMGSGLRRGDDIRRSRRMPSSTRWSATAAGGRAALLVTKPILVPRSWSCAMPLRRLAPRPDPDR